MNVLFMALFRYPQIVARQTETAEFLRAHDYRWLVKRWRAVVAKSGWRMRKFAEADGLPVYGIESSPQAAETRLYLSAGIHGDEPAATEALFTWVERRAASLGQISLLIFPCLNPWGLQNNDRHDAHGRDLNRGYRTRGVAVIDAQKAQVGDRTFDAAVMLHEDFDAQGVYVYEIPGARPLWGERLLAAAGRHVPHERRRRIEGRRCREGVVRVRVTPETMPDHPEAFFLHFGHTRRSLTLETPSEFSLTARVRAHMAMLDEVLRLLRGDRK